MAISYAAARNAPLLEWEDERLLIEDWQCRKDSAALEVLLLSHARLVYYWARKVGRDATEQEELVSEGIFGLIRAADMFDASHKVRFSTYARWWVKNAVLTALERLRAVVETPSGIRAPVATLVGDSADNLNALDQLPSDDPTPEERMIAKSSHSDMCLRLKDAMTSLSDLDREVVMCRSLKQPPDTIGDLANRLGMNAAKLRQLERRAMMRLKYELVARGVFTSRVQ